MRRYNHISLDFAQNTENELLQGVGLRIGIVCARFNLDITSALLEVCYSELLALKVNENDIELKNVPGALEIPLVLQTLAKTNRYDALVALGCVIRGDTYHFTLVANESASGISHISLKYNIPIANAILTVENLEQATLRQHIKGREAAQVAIEMANLKRRIECMVNAKEKLSTI